MARRRSAWETLREGERIRALQTISARLDMIDAVAPRTDIETERRQRFDALFATYSSDIVAYCGWRAGASDAQDAAAEVFLTAWRRLDELPEGDAARVWLYATARRVIANQRRSTRRRAALQERLAIEASTAPHAPPTDHEQSLVYEALHRLGPRDREVLLLSEWEGLTPTQIASVVGCLSVTARGRLHRARRRFRAVFAELCGHEVSTTQVFRRRIHEHV